MCGSESESEECSGEGGGTSSGENFVFQFGAQMVPTRFCFRDSGHVLLRASLWMRTLPWSSVVQHFVGRGAQWMRSPFHWTMFHTTAWPQGTKGWGLSKFPASDGPAPKLEVCREFPPTKLSPDEAPPPAARVACTNQCWSRQTHGLGGCIWMPHPQRPGQQPVSGTAHPRSSQTGQVIRGLR